MRDTRLLQMLLGRLHRCWQRCWEFCHCRGYRWQKLRKSQGLPDDSVFLRRNRRYLLRHRIKNFSRRSDLLAMIAVICLTATIGYPLYNQPLLKVGALAPQDYIAPRDAKVEDTETTEHKRREAKEQAIRVLMIDEVKNQEIERKRDSIIEKGDEIRAVAGKFPFVELSELTESTQLYLRRMREADWERLQETLRSPNPEKNIAKHAPTSVGKKTSRVASEYLFVSPNQPSFDQVNAASSDESIWPQSCSEDDCGRLTPVQKSEDVSDAEFNQALEELKTHQIAPISNFNSLLTKIKNARDSYARANRKRQDFILANPNSPDIFKDRLILDLLDSEWDNVKKLVTRSTKKILTQGVAKGLPPAIIENTIELHLELNLESIPSENVRTLARSMMMDLIEPNLQIDEQQTESNRRNAIKRVEPVYKEIKKGQIIVQRSRVLKQLDIDILEYFRLNRREILWRQLLQLSGTIAVSVLIMARVIYRTSYRWRQRDRLLILLLTLAVAGFLVITSQFDQFDFPYAPWSALGLLLGSFYGAVVGSSTIILLVLNLIMGLEQINISGVIAGGIAALVAANIAPRLRSREEFALLGVAIAGTEGCVYLLLKTLMGTVFSLWYEVLPSALFFGISGFSWSIVALGLSPYLEQLFDIVTPIRLAELANPNRPLLKRLAGETPGTFQHTLLVSSLAEAAARKLGCNVELVRAGCLYHDIGKMHDPLSFIENQMGRPNKHETEIKDPWVSAAIIKKHVTEGLVMARRHRLPTAIQAFIPEHQGTMTIGYFYHQAQQIAQENPHIHVDESDFRYDGPIPQSRETGIVMLADSCEAALRSLQDATPEQALNMLNNILRARWKDNQLINSGLTRADMNTIAEVFVEVWQQFHHKRIAYPKLKAGK